LEKNPATSAYPKSILPLNVGIGTLFFNIAARAENPVVY
jgi:hypothetical protein